MRGVYLAGAIACAVLGIWLNALLIGSYASREERAQRQEERVNRLGNKRVVGNAQEILSQVYQLGLEEEKIRDIRNETGIGAVVACAFCCLVVTGFACIGAYVCIASRTSASLLAFNKGSETMPNPEVKANDPWTKFCQPSSETMPNPEVKAKANRRRFGKEYPFTDH